MDKMTICWFRCCLCHVFWGNSGSLVIRAACSGALGAVFSVATHHSLDKKYIYIYIYLICCFANINLLIFYIFLSCSDFLLDNNNKVKKKKIRRPQVADPSGPRLHPPRSMGSPWFDLRQTVYGVVVSLGVSVQKKSSPNIGKPNWPRC